MMRQGSRISFVCDRWCCARRGRLSGRCHWRCQPSWLCGTGVVSATLSANDDERADGHFALVQSVEAMHRCRHRAGADFWKERERLRESDSGESFFRGGGLTADTRRMLRVRRIPSEVLQ